MSKYFIATLASASLLAVAACNQSEEPPGAASAPTIYESMTEVVDPQSQAFWNSSFDAMNDVGEIVPEKLTDEQMAQIRAAIVSIRDDARQLAEADHVVVAPQGVKIMNEGMEGALGAAEVQALIDADPEGFAEQAQEFATITDNMLQGLETGDASLLNDAAFRFGDICTECHVKYWYPSE